MLQRFVLVLNQESLSDVSCETNSMFIKISLIKQIFPGTGDLEYSLETENEISDQGLLPAEFSLELAEYCR